MIKLHDYILITASMNGNHVTAISIIATDKNMALAKAYSYFGADSRLKLGEFNILCEHALFERVRRVFQEFTGETILYFAEKDKFYFIDELSQIDIIKCIEVE